MHNQLMALHAALPKLSQADADFARSLLLQAVNAANGHKGCQPLSTKQLYWVGKLTERANPPKAATPATTVGDFSAVAALFAKAGEHLKHPKVRLQLPDGKPIVLSVAGAAARMPGTVNVTDGGPYGASKFYGRVTQAGKWLPGLSSANETDTAIVALLTAFAADPAKVATAYGKLIGSCCFCGITLTDQRSVTVGYGPICAEKWNLPWGEK